MLMQKYVMMEIQIMVMVLFISLISCLGCSGDCFTQDPLYDCLVPGQLCTKKCGNGKMDPGEVCDDGNRVGGDGCSVSCTVESGYKCPAPGPWYFYLKKFS
jgi:cysteine-rich repeat protein